MHVFIQLYTRIAREELGFKSVIPLDAVVYPTQLKDGLTYGVVLPHGHKGHRVRVKCPLCNKWLPAGRLHQHVKVHGDYKVHNVYHLS